VAIEYKTTPVKLSVQHTLNCMKNITGQENNDACNGGRFVFTNKQFIFKLCLHQTLPILVCRIFKVSKFYREIFRISSSCMCEDMSFPEKFLSKYLNYFKFYRDFLPR
jgi:hypothetical protein